MADQQYEVSEDEMAIALSGATIQAEAHGLDMKDEKVQKYVKHMAGLMANEHAHVRYLYNLLNKNMGIGDAE